MAEDREVVKPKRGELDGTGPVTLTVTPRTEHLRLHLAHESLCVRARGLKELLEVEYGIPPKVSRVRVNNQGVASFNNLQGVRRSGQTSDPHLIAVADKALAEGKLPEDSQPLTPFSGTFKYERRVEQRTEEQKAQDRDYRRRHPQKKQSKTDPLARVKQYGPEFTDMLLKQATK